MSFRVGKVRTTMTPFFQRTDYYGPRSGSDNPGSKVTPQMRKEMLEKYLAGATVSELCQMYKICPGTVRKRLGHQYKSRRDIGKRK